MKIIRKVFIISAPLSLATQKAQFYWGVKEDVELYKRYFRSSIGGAFENSEIIVLENASWTEIKRALLLNFAHFTTVVFTGHGFISNLTSKTVLNINATEKISVAKIIENIQSKRKLLLVDACRVLRNDTEHFVGFGGPEVREQISFQSSLSRERGRAIFDIALRKTAIGTQILYSCSPGESSGVNFDGSTFSNALLRPVSNWAKKIENHNTLNAADAFEFSKYMLRFKADQTPRLRVSKDTAPNFPFAVRYSLSILERDLMML